MNSDEAMVEVVADRIAPIRHRCAPFGLKRCKTMAIDLEIAQAAIAAARPMVLEEAAKVAEGFSRMADKPDHADAPKLIATAIRKLGGRG